MFVIHLTISCCLHTSLLALNELLLQYDTQFACLNNEL